MMLRLSDYVAGFLVSQGVTDVFSVVDGGAMHLNDTLGYQRGNYGFGSSLCSTDNSTNRMDPLDL